jgi:hypothetical protein
MPAIQLFNIQVAPADQDVLGYERCVPYAPLGSLYVRAASFQEAVDKASPKIREMSLGKQNQLGLRLQANR